MPQDKIRRRVIGPNNIPRLVGNETIVQRSSESDGCSGNKIVNPDIHRVAAPRTVCGKNTGPCGGVH